ncbi:MAG: PAS domain S-box protein [Chloroflexota bacterium]
MITKDKNAGDEFPQLREQAEKTLERQKVDTREPSELSTEEALRKAHDELERSVEERIAELVKVNEQLKIEIEERKEAEESLRQSEEKYRTILENIEDGYYEVDIAGNFTFFNDSMCRMIGYSNDEITGMNNRQYMDEENAKRVFQSFNYVYRTEKPIKGLDWKLIRKDGSDCFVETSVSLIKDSRGQPVGFRGIARDVSYRKEMEKALRESKADLDKAQRIAHVGSWSRDPQTDKGQWSDQMYRMLGFSPGSPENPTRETFLSRVHPADRERVSSALKDAVEKKGSFDFEFRTVPIEGSERIFRERGQVECDETGTPPVRIFGTAQDITERRRLQTQLQEATKMEAIATLAGGIAHQFNNALSSITGHSGLLEMEYPEDEKIMDYAKAMKQSAHRMAHLTSQLLAYARGGKYNPQTMSLSNFVEGTLPIIQHTLDPDIRLETDLPQDVMNVEVDRTQMQMVLSAIVANSNEAIDPPGRIRISTRNMDLAKEFTKDHPGLKPGPYVCLSIEDDGKGMDEETKNRIFDPFFTTHFIGRGLGMASVYGIIKNHDGTITVDSEIGKGTVVRIYLPAIPSAQARRAGLPAIEAEQKVEEKVVSEPKVELAGGEGTILVIEDEEPLVELFRQILEMLGYSVLQAKTGKEAVELAKSFDGQIDLALLDIKLPDMNGGRVYPLIMEARPDLKVIVCSGYSIDGPAQAILDAGAEGFIQKPFLIAPFAEKLKEVLEGN